MSLVFSGPRVAQLHAIDGNPASAVAREYRVFDDLGGPSRLDVLWRTGVPADLFRARLRRGGERRSRSWRGWKDESASSTAGLRRRRQIVLVRGEGSVD